VGSAFRTAEAVSPCALFLCGCCALPGNRRLAHTARGTQEAVLWRHFDQASEAAGWLKATGRRIVAVEGGRGSRTLFDAGFSVSDAFVFGNEALGVSGDVLSGADMVVGLPQTGRRSCMNVASALAVVAMEIQRMRLAAGWILPAPCGVSSPSLEEDMED